jgi:methyltransferase, FkbM family
MKQLLKKLVQLLFNCTIQYPTVYDAMQRTFSKISNLLYITEISYATNFEDMIAKFYCNQHRNRNGGFYVDVGALDPFRFSNTYALYLAGWKGINIEPRRDCIQKFERYRKSDINLNIGISSETREMDYYSFQEPAYNTTQKERADYVIQQGYSQLIHSYKIKTLPLRDVFASNGVPATGIDFLAIDVEGHELSVLQSNDWQLYRPFFIAMESLMSRENGYNIQYLDEDPAVKFLLKQGYHIVAKVRNKLFFVDSKQ